MFRFETLEIWKLSREYGRALFQIGQKLRVAHQYSIADQLERAGLSSSSNIVEGSGSTTANDFKNFLDISIKSTLETVNILFFVADLGVISTNERLRLYDKAEILIKKVRSFKLTVRDLR